MIKKILVPLDPSPYAASAVKYAGYIAERQNATVTGMVTYDIPGIEKSIGSYPTGGMYWAEKLEESRMEEAKQKIYQMLDDFKASCKKENIKWQEAEVQGIPSKMILAEGMFYDLIVVGQKTFYHFETQNEPGDSLEKILDHSITPILAVPEKFKPIKNVLIAFDGSLPATRALKRFAHLAMVNDFEIKLLMAKTDLKTGEYYLNKAENYLKDYGVTRITKEWSPEEVIDIVDEKYLDWADLFVTGMHSKKGLLDFFVGSLPKYLLKKSNVPVLIGQ